MAWLFDPHRAVLQWDEPYEDFVFRLSAPIDWGCRWVGAVKNGTVKFKFPIAEEHKDNEALIHHLKTRVDDWEV